MTVPNGVDEDRFYEQAKSEELAAACGVLGKRVILTVARLDYHKGHADVIRALPGVIERVGETAYLIVGDGPLRDELKQLARSLGVEEEVVFLGPVDDSRLVELYNLADVFIMISQETEKDVEGFGLVFLEANACGKPVVGGDSGGVAEAIAHKVTGLLVHPGDVEGIACALTDVLSDEGLARRLGSAGRRRVEREYNWASTAAKLWAVFKDVAEVDAR
jgi:phosphatidylinositol alpha-1,6-mannosyltransferase